MALTPKQERFVEEYLVDLNATAAAVRAGYSEKTANRIGSENLSKPDIQAAIYAGMKKRSERTKVTIDRVIEGLAEIAFSSVEEYREKMGMELKPSDKTKALELLGKHLGGFTEKIAIASIDPKAVEEVETMIYDAAAGS